MEENEWVEFFSTYERLLERMVSRYPIGLRDEARQVARIACWRRLAFYDAKRGASLSSYVYLIVRGALLNWDAKEYRWQSRHQFPAPCGEDGEGDWQDMIVDTNAWPPDEAAVWQAWMTHLTEAEARCLTLHIRYGHSLKDVAAIIGIPYERVKKQKQRALGKLRKALETYMKE
ncbi:RNA polymerase sigma factor [Aneurinibacillus danicus]|uniref:RNA polymerase sigma-70 region 4 domain-containing protein n=1 Tax=Aneurinibacillus danicus TaxID=267746 RepID=A0A511V8G4_9BACL|nr:sigma-70 family RNA polymerase sigma factor [Aneurinibacillus danicus]GEN35170.1 hypothetical protein ADA01nite_26300 [Aneurinibacillus danicus]